MSHGQKVTYTKEGTFTGFSKEGGIASINSNGGNEHGLILAFVSPYAGKVTISDLFVEYNIWGYPNNLELLEKKPYEVDGNQFGRTFDGYKFKVEVNGLQVYPEDGGWDEDSLTNKYKEVTPCENPAGAGQSFAEGDLIPRRRRKIFPGFLCGNTMSSAYFQYDGFKRGNFRQQLSF